MFVEVKIVVRTVNKLFQQGILHFQTNFRYQVIQKPSLLEHVILC